MNSNHKPRKNFYILFLILLLSVALNTAFIFNNKSTIKVYLKECFFKRKLDYENTPLAYYAYLNNIYNLKDTLFYTDNINTLPNKLIIAPGIYEIFERTYHLKSEGLYRFLNPEISNAQRIVYKNDIDALLSSIAWIASHGNADNGKSFKELNNKALHSKLFLTCGHISSWALNLLNNQNILARRVSGLTLEKWNSYDNGHVMIEVYRESLNKWVLYDLNKGVYFTKNDTLLSLIEFVNLIETQKYEIVPFSQNAKSDISNFKSRKTNYDYAFFVEKINANLKEWYKRVMQVPLINHEGKNYFFDKANKTRIETYSSSYFFMNEEDFMIFFYSPI